MTVSEAQRATIRELSDRFLKLQKPIRVLNAVKWDDAVQAAFLANPGAQPAVDANYYDAHPLSFDGGELKGAFGQLVGDVNNQLGSESAVSQLLIRECVQYQTTIDLLEARGTRAFGELGAQLYGAADEPFHRNGPSAVDMARQIHAGWKALGTQDFDQRGDLTAAQAVVILQEQLDASLEPGMVDVRIDDGIVADAAAGSSYIKLREDAMFSHAQLDQLEAHEGWVHVATSQNGQRQSVCTFLAKAAPPTTVTQEGLATLTEIVSMRSHPARLHRIADRINAIDDAANGATFLDVYRHFIDEGQAPSDAYLFAMRIFRGSTPIGPPFHKDLAYGRGLVQAYAYVRVAVDEGRLDRIPTLFAGKLDLADIGLINQLLDEGIVDPPAVIPPPFTQPAAIVASMLFAQFLPELDFDALGDQYRELL